MKDISSSINADTTKASAAVNDSLAEIATGMMNDYAEENTDPMSGMAVICALRADGHAQRSRCGAERRRPAVPSAH
ncbi:MAG: hypothetical protein IIX49_02105 [Oscillospiraceae bacterium]|nr:hypothetical protein [Oscillospiraceae bacterium]